MSGFIGRENDIIDVLDGLTAAGLSFVVVGGYGVSAYQHRFSVDADLVIRSADMERFAGALDDRGFVTDAAVELEGGDRFVSFVMDAELPVTVDLFVGGLQSRQTGAAWPYDYVEEHSVEREIEGSERSVRVHVPTAELLIAVKLHSGRLTDVRDVVALLEDADLDTVERHLDRGDQDTLGAILETVEASVSDEDFVDSFKGVFSRQSLPEQQIQELRDFIRDRPYVGR